MQIPSIYQAVLLFPIILALLLPSLQASRLEKRPFVSAQYFPEYDERIGRNLRSPQQCVASFGRPKLADCTALIEYMERGEDATIYQSLLSDDARMRSSVPSDNSLVPADGQPGGDYIVLPRVYSWKTCAIGIHTVQRNDYSDDIAAKSVISETGTRIVYDCLRASRATVARPNPDTGSTTTGQALACGGWALAGEALNLNVTLFYSSSLRNVKEVNSILVQNQCMYRRLVGNPAAPPCNNGVGGGGESDEDTESMDSMEQSMSIEESELQAAMSGGVEPSQQRAKILNKPVYCRTKDVRSGNEGCIEGEKCLSIKSDWLSLVLGVVANTIVELGNCVLIQGESSI